MYIVIMGGGKVGEYLASVLLGKGHEVAVLESDRDTADHLSVELQGEYLIINGDGCDSDFQEDAGIRKADVFVAVTGRDDDNLVACEIATRVFNVNRCIARVNNPKNRDSTEASPLQDGRRRARRRYRSARRQPAHRC